MRTAGTAMYTRQSSKHKCTADCQSRECVLRELRCELVEIRSKTGPLTVKVGQRSDCVVITGGRLFPLHYLILKQK
ncbi:hypothetical protein V1477_016842 [Vespula maculifrons]|uniref:Uncharacterized protein n=1 Tax=Vespula maculifrons TaxID=7453 RepID=A0ABD2B4G4_VESMC